MATLTTATIKGITYNRGDSFVVKTETKGYGTASGGGDSTTAKVGETWYFVSYNNEGVSYPYSLKYNSAPSSSGDVTGWFNTSVFPSATYTITYNANGGTGAPAAQSKTYGTNLTLSSTKPTRTGYTFLGWSTSSTATSATYSAGGAYTTDASATLYAVWQINSYTLHVYLNGGTWNGSTDNQSFTQTYNSTKTLSPPTREGYIFGGWAWTSYGTMNNSFACSTIAGTQHGIRVYNNKANGSVTHTFVADGVKPNFGNSYITISKSTDIASPGLGGFVRSLDAENNTTYIHTFYAKLPTGFHFSRHQNLLPSDTTYTWITSNTGTGDWRLYSYKVVTGSGSMGTPHDFGYVAANLTSNSTDSTASVTWYLGANQITKEPTKNQTFTFGAGNTWMYAMWIPYRLTTIYNANGGTQPVDNPYKLPFKYTIDYGENYNGTNGLTDFATFGLAKAGYKATYWNTKPDGTGVSINETDSFTAQSLAEAVGENLAIGNVTINFYPLWEPNGLVRLYTGNAFSPHMIYIYNATNAKWEQYIPYIYTGGKWTLFS